MSNHSRQNQRYSSQPYPHFADTARVRRKRRSKYDVSRIFERSQSRSFFECQSGQTKFYQSEMETLKSGIDCNYKRIGARKGQEIFV